MKNYGVRNAISPTFSFEKWGKIIKQFMHNFIFLVKSMNLSF